MVWCTHGRILGLPQPTCKIMGVLSLKWPTQLKTGKLDWKPISSGGMYVQIQSMFSVYKPPAKWKSPADVTEPHLTKCGEPSFGNGNIIIAVERTHFRVYREVLTSLSSVFANMFTNPQPTKANMQNYGCPVIELNSSAEDWEIILKAYFLRRYVCKNPINVFSFDHSYKPPAK